MPVTDADTERLTKLWRILSMGANIAGDEWAVRFLAEHFTLRPLPRDGIDAMLGRPRAEDTRDGN